MPLNTQHPTAISIDFRPLIYATLLSLVLPVTAQAHELWELTADQVLNWNNKAKTETYSGLSFATAVVLVCALLINLALVHLNANGAGERFPKLRARLRSMRPLTSVVLRFCLAWALLSSALAFDPLFGDGLFSEPSLLAPDIVISDLPEHWQWLLWLEVVLGVALAAGIYTRLAASACLLLVGCTIYSAGLLSLVYTPSFIGVSIYLLVAGGGIWFVPLPAPGGSTRLSETLIRTVSISRAQFILRLLVGLNFLYMAVYFKVLQPTLTLAIIDVHQLPVMGLDPELFVLIQAVVEVSIGLLIIFGVLLQFLSVAFIGALVFFAICLPAAENPGSHVLYYGVALAFLFSGNGRFRFQQAKDSAAHIIVLGNGLAAVTAIRRLEKLLPDQTNVRLTLLSDRTDYQISAMLPELVSGAVPATSVAHPFIKVLGKTRLRLGSPHRIDYAAKTIFLDDGSDLTYDQLVFARPETPEHRMIQGAVKSVYQLNTVADALQLKRSILHQAAIASYDPTRYKGIANFAIVGGGEQGSALAVEISALIENLKVDHLVGRDFQPNLVLFEDDADTALLDKKLISARADVFKKYGVKTANTRAISRLTGSSIILKSGGSIDIGTVINLRCRRPENLLPPHPHGEPLFDNTLSMTGQTDVWMATLTEHTAADVDQSQDTIWRKLPTSTAQAKLAAFNAWSSSQHLAPSKITRNQQRSYQFYMGRHTVGLWRGITVPGWLARTGTRIRFLKQIPSVERKLRVCLDWIFGLVFSNDQTVLVDDNISNLQPKPKNGYTPIIALNSIPSVSAIKNCPPLAPLRHSRYG